ncbi:MAG TPA: xanthine dehydrogenase family protein subunit M [Candidatus Binataceae bacterium]|nr:xanthine dehydrogenase family protein subunit M [Candidatus Binataceae bacterium]
MFPAEFQYHRATSTEQALTLLEQLGEDAKFIAGGQSLLPMMKIRLAQPSHLIDIGAIADLSYIRQSAGTIAIGACTPHADVASSPQIAQGLPMLVECAGEIGDVQIRNRGTLGGSLAHADPAADYPAAMLALEAEISARSRHGTRTIKAQDFFLDLMTTALAPNELLSEVRVNLPPPHTGMTYLKFRHPASGFATVGVAALITLDDKGECAAVRVGITGLAAKAFRAAAVENALTNRPLDPQVIEQAAAHADDAIDPLSDLNASADFRRHLARVLTRRALTQALARAR